MARDEGAGAGSILLAFLLGAVSGAAVALLYAPATGDDTREYLNARAREGRERAAEAAQKGRERAAEAAQKGRELINQGRELINQGRETLTTAIDRGREAYQKARTQEPS